MKPSIASLRWQDIHLAGGNGLGGSWLVEEDLGSKVALAVARGLVLFLKRPGGQAQFSRSLAAQSSTRKSMQELLVWIVENLGKNLTVISPLLGGT
jgi:transcriptional regulator GlxA family with amidase domain